MGKLAVTGITGKSGRYFLEEILRNEDAVLGKWDTIHFSSRNAAKAAQINKRAEGRKIIFQPFIGDVCDKQFCKELCKGCDTLLHIAGIHSSRIVVESAIEAGVKRMILVHTTGIYSKYKRAGEEYRQTDEMVCKACREKNTALTILRPTMIYGSLQDGNVSVFIRMVDRLPVMPTVNGAHYGLQPVHCRDLGTAYYKVLVTEQTAGKDYILSGGEPIELRQMFEVIACNLGVKRKYLNCPYPIAFAGAWGIYVITFGRRDYREKVQRLVEPRVYSHEEASRDFGYNPVNFEAGVVKEVQEYIRKNHKRRREASGVRHGKLQ